MLVNTKGYHIELIRYYRELWTMSLFITSYITNGHPLSRKIKLGFLSDLHSVIQRYIVHWVVGYNNVIQ